MNEEQQVKKKQKQEKPILKPFNYDVLYSLIQLN